MLHLDVDAMDLKDIQAVADEARGKIFCSIMITNEEQLHSGYSNFQAIAKALKPEFLILSDSNPNSLNSLTEDLTFEPKTIILSGLFYSNLCQFFSR